MDVLFKKKDTTTRDFKRTQVLTEQQQPEQSASEQYQIMTAKMGFMVTDELVIKLIWDEPHFHPLIPVFSIVNASGRITKKVADIMKLRLENIIARLKLTMKQDLVDRGGLDTLEGLRIYGYYRINEIIDGWKGHLITEQVKVIETRDKAKH